MGMVVEFKVNGELINRFRYVDDAVILADSTESVQLYLIQQGRKLV